MFRNGVGTNVPTKCHLGRINIKAFTEEEKVEMVVNVLTDLKEKEE
jgi:hypothetical protein